MPTLYTWIGGTGSQSWATAGNWTPGTGPPATGDSAYITSGGSTIDTGLAQSAVTLANLVVGNQFAGTIGTSTTPMAISATSFLFDGSASGRLNFDFGTVVFTGTIVSGSNSADSNLGLQAIRIKGVNASNKLFVLGGNVGIATNTVTDVATIPEFDILNTGTVLTLSSGVTATTVTQTQGTCYAACAIPAFSQDAGTLYTSGSGSIGSGALSIGGSVFSNSTGAVRKCFIRSGGVLDFSQSPAPRSATETITMYKGAKIVSDTRFVTLTGGITLSGCKLSDLNVDIGTGRVLTIT